MVTFRFITVGENLGTRKLGEKTRNELLPLLRGDERVMPSAPWSGLSRKKYCSFSSESVVKWNTSVRLLPPASSLPFHEPRSLLRCAPAVVESVMMLNRMQRNSFMGSIELSIRLAVSQISQCYDQDVGHDVETAGNPER